MIDNTQELLAAFTGEDPIESSIRAGELLEKYIFKYTRCGCSFTHDEKGIRVAGYAEGSNADLDSYPLHWGFTIDEFNAILDIADQEGCDEWELCNLD